MRSADHPNSSFALVQNVLNNASGRYRLSTIRRPRVPIFNPTFLVVPSVARFETPIRVSSTGRRPPPNHPPPADTPRPFVVVQQQAMIRPKSSAVSSFVRGLPSLQPGLRSPRRCKSRPDYLEQPKRIIQAIRLYHLRASTSRV